MHLSTLKPHFSKFFPSLLILLVASILSGCMNGSEVDERLESIRDAKRAPGTSAKEILSEEKFKSIWLEVHYMEGFPPSASALSNLEDWILKHTNKSQGLELTLKEIPAAGQDNYSVTEVREIEDQNRTAYNFGNKLGMYILILDGYYEKDTDTQASLGFAYRNTSIALMGKRVDERSGGFAKPDLETLETTVLEHEFGHLMGLVNLGASMVTEHEDDDNSGHCDNGECLMYWAVESSYIYNHFGGEVPKLGANCLADLKAAGGK